MGHTIRLAIGVVSVLAVLQGCDRPQPLSPEGAIATADPAMSQAAKKLDPALCALDRGGFTLNSTNPYFPLGVGSEWFLEGEEDDAFIEVQITVLDETEDVGGVTTRVVAEREWEDGELLEISRNFFAEASDGTVCYFGEDVDIFEDGEVSHEGAWRADGPGNAPGIIMPANPHPGMKFRMEIAPGIAEDEGKIVGIGPVDVPADRFTETIRVEESNPLEGDKDFKVYAKDVGIIIDGPLALVSYVVTGI